MELNLHMGRGKQRRNYLNSINILERCSSCRYGRNRSLVNYINWHWYTQSPSL